MCPENEAPLSQEEMDAIEAWAEEMASRPIEELCGDGTGLPIPNACEVDFVDAEDYDDEDPEFW